MITNEAVTYLDTDLEPLELSKEQENVVIARMKKLAKDPEYDFANALELVHKSYQQQDWERQKVIGDLVRPSPPDRAAWTQYEKFIQLAVKLLSKYRGVNGLWRSERYDTVPTNQRASMGSMAASRIKNETIMKQVKTPMIVEAVHKCNTLEQLVGSVNKVLRECTNGLYTVELIEKTNNQLWLVVRDEIQLPVEVIKLECHV